MTVRHSLRLALLACAASLVFAPAARAADSQTLTIYNGQDEGPVEAAAAAFEKKTGIKVEMRKGGSPAFANQIIQEGARSPADVFYSEYTSPLAILKDKNLLAEVPAETLAEIPARFNDAGKMWLGVTARNQAMLYNKTMISEDKLPESVLDFAKPEWSGKVAFNPKSAAFLEEVTAVIQAKGEATAKAWLTALKTGAKAYPSNTAIVVAVDRGEVETAIVGDNYWFAVAEERGADKMNARVHYVGHKDPGSLVTVSAAAILKSAPHPDVAQKFLAFLASADGQTAVAAAAADYPLRPGIVSPYKLTPLADLDVSPITPSDIGTAHVALELERSVGLN
ncbi:extracellular solute-binding protein [Lichenihabitans sp. PAMC28606]|uniref:extracellular solute-binding protein n=1 Tax=Lichenihabitans sp. PAMC28606 TaxID=2880932 RepID=UPI001D0B008A|nr:extracellular solute-binding protein [Lichenihabitans sp. PAMC28606]UDL95968.1 extracellular solute-binding protein [Lichenihabitans sp. PAMC28606]